METELLLQGKVYWSYDFEYAEINNRIKTLASVMSMPTPLHSHNGYIGLTETALIIEGSEEDTDLTIPLYRITKIYLGYDDIFTNTSVKNFGTLWQPLRISFYDGRLVEHIYLIIDHNGLFTHNKRWYDALTTILR